MEQTEGPRETNKSNNDSEEEAPSSNSSNGVTHRASSRKRALRLYSSDQSEVTKSTTPTPQEEEQTNIPGCPLTRSKALSSGAVQNLSCSSSSVSPDDSSGDNSEGGARDKTTPLVKTRPTRKGRFVKGTTLMASLKVKQNGAGTNTCKTKRGASSNRRPIRGKEETSPVSDNTAANDKNATAGSIDNEDDVFGNVWASIPDVGLCSFSDEVASVNSSKRKKRSVSPPLDSDPHKSNKASKMSDEDSDRVLSPEIDLQNQTTATSSIQTPDVHAVEQDGGVITSSQSWYTTAGHYNPITTQELVSNTPINTTMPIGAARVPNHSSHSLVGIHWSNEGGTRHPLMATGPSILSVPEEIQNVSIIDTSAFPFQTFGGKGKRKESVSGENIPLFHRTNKNTSSNSRYTIHHRVNSDHVTSGRVTGGHVTSGHVTGGNGHVTDGSGHETSGHLTGGHVTGGHVTSVAGQLSDVSLMQGHFLYPSRFNEYSLSHGAVLTNAVSSPITSSIINEAISTSSLSNTSSTTNKGINSVHTGINFATNSAQARINAAHSGINSLHSSSGGLPSSKIDNNIRLSSPDTLSIVHVSSPLGVTSSSYSPSLSHLASPPVTISPAGASTSKTSLTTTHSSPLVSNLLMNLPSHFQSIGLTSTVSDRPNPLSPPPFSSPFLSPSSLYSIVGMNLTTAATVSTSSKKSSAARRSSLPSSTSSKKNNKSSQAKTTSARSTSAKKVFHSSASGSKSSRTNSTSSSKTSKKSSLGKTSLQASSPSYLHVSSEWKDSLQIKMRDLLRITSKSNESRSGMTTPSALTVTPITPSNSNNFPFPVPISPHPSSLAPSLLSPLSPSSLPLSPSSLPLSPPRTRPSKKPTKQSRGCTNKLTRPPPMRATTPSVLGKTRGSPQFNAGTHHPSTPVPLTAAIASCLISPDQIDILGLNNFSSSLLSLLTGGAGFACLDAINYAELERQFRSAQSILETQQLHVNNLKNRLVQARFQQQVLLLQSDHYQGCTKNLILPSMRDQLEVPVSIPGYKTDLKGSISPDQWKGSFERPHLECLDFYSNV